MALRSYKGTSLLTSNHIVQGLGTWPAPLRLLMLGASKEEGPSEQPSLPLPDCILHCYVPLRGPRCAAGAWSAVAWRPGWHHLLSQT